MKDSKAKLTRWAIFLQGFSFDLEHVPGKNNELPDALSRAPGQEVLSQDPADAERMLPPEQTYQEPSPIIAHTEVGSLFGEIAAAQQEDQELTNIVTKLRSDSPRQTKTSLYLDKDGLWQRNEAGELRLFVPYNYHRRVLEAYHDDALAGHPGMDETLRAIQRVYYWKTMRNDIRNYVRSCALCACSKAARSAGNFDLRPRRPERTWEVAALDLMGPYPRTSKGKRYILVITDLFSRWVEAFALGNAETTTIIQTLERELFPRWGYPKALLSDNGPQFTGGLWNDTCRNWGLQHWTTPVYHPQANPTERRNQEIKKGLRLRLGHQGHRSWDRYLPEILFNLRTRRNGATGVTPSELLLGRNLRRPGEWRLRNHDTDKEETNHLASRVAEARQHQRRYLSKYADIPEEEEERKKKLRPGTQVYIQNYKLSNAADNYNAALAPKRIGPHPIVEHAGGDVYLVQRDERAVKYHRSQLLVANEPTTELRTEEEQKCSATTQSKATKPSPTIGSVAAAAAIPSAAETVSEPRLTTTPASRYQGRSHKPSLSAVASSQHIDNAVLRRETVIEPYLAPPKSAREEAPDAIQPLDMPSSLPATCLEPRPTHGPIRRRRGRPRKAEAQQLAAARLPVYRSVHPYQLRPRTRSAPLG